MKRFCDCIGLCIGLRPELVNTHSCRLDAQLFQYCGDGNPYQTPKTETMAREPFYKRRKFVYGSMIMLAITIIFLRWFAANIYDTMTFIHNNYLGEGDGYTISVIRYIFSFFL